MPRLRRRRNEKNFMQSKGILPDTCIWIEYFKAGASPLKQALPRLLLNDNIFICGPVLYELTQGLQSDKERISVMDGLNSLEYIEMSKDLWNKAGELSSTLRKEGKTIPFSDILIASIAIENNLSVFTIDKHFDGMPNLKIYRI